MRNKALVFFMLLVFCMGKPDTAHAKVDAIWAVARTVSDMERSIRFYRDVLRFKKRSDEFISGDPAENFFGLYDVEYRTVLMYLGEDAIELTEFNRPKGRPVPRDMQSNDHFFQYLAVAVRDIKEAFKTLNDAGVEMISPHPETLSEPPEVSGMSAFLCNDPDGHPLMFLAYPQDKGNPKWHRDTQDLFLGIDHTAVVTESIEVSLPFYRDTLGLHVTRQGKRYGIREERLRNLLGAHMWTAELHAAQGMGFMLIEYINPVGGRNIPHDRKPNDLIYSETIMQTKELSDIATHVPIASVTSPLGKAYSEKYEQTDKTDRILLDDPDGHVIVLMGK